MAVFSSIIAITIAHGAGISATKQHWFDGCNLVTGIDLGWCECELKVNMTEEIEILTKTSTTY